MIRKRKPTHPGEILKCHYLEPLHLSITEVAEVLDVSRKVLSEIVNGRAGITPNLALRLARAFHTTPELWLNIQQTYNLWSAARTDKGWRRVPMLRLQVAH